MNSTSGFSPVPVVCHCLKFFQMSTVWVSDALALEQISKDKGNGVVAKRKILQGELLLRVPYEDCLWPKDQLDEAGLITSINTVLHDLNHPLYSRLRKIIDSKVLEAVPLFGKHHELFTTSDSSVSFLYRAMIEGIGLDRSDAAKIMVSRCFASSSKFGSIAYVPFADDFNHSTNAWNTRIREDDGFLFYAESEIQEKEEIRNCYGIETGVEMYLTHGFLEDALGMSILIIPVTVGGSERLVRIDVDNLNEIESWDISLLGDMRRECQSITLSLVRMLERDEVERDQYLSVLLAADLSNVEKLEAYLVTRIENS